MAAKLVATEDLTAGSVLADAVLSVSGKILLGKGVALTSRHIVLLKTWDVKTVFINYGADDSVTEPSPAAPPPISGPNYSQFSREYSLILGDTARIFDFIRKRNIIPLPHLKERVENINSTIKNTGPEIIADLLIQNSKLVDYVIHHSLIVSFFTAIIAQQMKWKELDISGAALAGLLHDLGNLTVDVSEVIRGKTYITETASLLKKLNGIPNEVILGILQHREYLDGSGFPTGVGRDKIHPYARIVAVADCFYNNAYRDNEYANPFLALDILGQEMLGKLDLSICQTFITRLQDSLLHNKILLSNGRDAEIIFFPNGSYLPLVRTKDDQIIDLAKYGTSMVKRIIAPDQ